MRITAIMMVVMGLEVIVILNSNEFGDLDLDLCLCFI